VCVESFIVKDCNYYQIITITLHSFRAYSIKLSCIIIIYVKKIIHFYYKDAYKIQLNNFLNAYSYAAMQVYLDKPLTYMNNYGRYFIVGSYFKTVLRCKYDSVIGL